jgi:protein Mpv17
MARTARMQFLRAYDQLLAKRPVLIKSVTSAVLFGAGDVLSQKLDKDKPLDSKRTLRMVLWGGTFGVLAHGWYVGSTPCLCV